MCDDPQLPEPLAKMRQKLDGSEKDKRLYELIENFCQQGSNKIKKNRAFTPLLAEIKKLRGLKKPTSYHPEYEDILQETWGLVAQKICTEFDPQGKNLRNSLTLWINEKLRLKYKVLDLFSTGKKPPEPTSIDAQVYDGSDDSQPLTLKDLIAAAGSDPMEQTLQEEEEERQQKLQVKIQEAGCYPEGYPHCNCGEIARRRIVQKPAQKWKDMAAELKIPQGTLTSHWQRICKPLLAEIQQLFKEE